MRKLFRPPGISAMDLLQAIRPRAGTYLGLPRDTVTPQPELGFFAKALEQGLEHSMTVKHNCRNRDSRKELTLLAAVLVPPSWFILLKKDLLLINPRHSNFKKPTALDLGVLGWTPPRSICTTNDS